MKPRYSLLLMAFLSLITLSAFGQTDKKVTIKNFKLSENETHLHTQKICVMANFDVHFNWIEPSSSNRRYKLYWGLRDANGKLVFDSRNEESIFLNDESIDAQLKDGYMKDDDEDIFIPNKSINLPAGTHTLSLIFSLNGKGQDFPEFHSEQITIHQQNYASHSLNDQEFTVSNVEFLPFSEGFGVDAPGITTKFNLGLKYGPDDCADENYYLRWEFQDLAGKRLFNSRSASSIHHRKEAIYLKNFRNETDKVDMFTQYGDFAIEGDTEVQFVVFAYTSEGDLEKEVFRKNYLIKLPGTYKYQEQEFALSDTDLGHYRQEGTQGIRLNSTCTFKFDGPLANDEYGDKYVFKLTLKDASGKSLLIKNDFTNEGDPDSYKYATAPKFHEPEKDIKLFLPYHRMNLSPGNHTISYQLTVSDYSGSFTFPTLLEGKFEINMPEVHEALLTISKLLLHSSDYDTRVSPIGSELPDPFWTLKVGYEIYYKSITLDNTLFGPTGTARFPYAEGDEVAIRIYDHDKGFFNPNDLIKTIYLPYLKKGSSFSMVDYSEGKVAELDLTWKRIK